MAIAVPGSVDSLAEMPAVVAGRYQVERPVGRGGMSWVYKVIDREDGSYAAMKVLRPELAHSTGIVRRLASEAVTMMLLDHPNICRVRAMDVDPDTGLRFIVMDWAALGSASQLLKRTGRLIPSHAAGIIVQTLCGLSVAHERQIVHRDVKPGNILIDAEGRAMLTDFGVARVPDADSDTNHGAMLGSFSYMAPEQRLRSDSVGPEADLYAVGATLYNLCTGESPLDLFLTTPTDPRWDELPEPLRPIVRRATAYSPGQRYPSARAMARDLQPFVVPRLWREQPHLVAWLSA